MGMNRKRDNFIYRHNYIRLSSLELVAQEIREKNIRGCVAELGVYKGDFAQYINMSFPDSRLYLFDTFEGFDSRDVDTEKEKHYAKGLDRFSDTSVELVLSKMKYPDNCIVRKGYFPETAQDVDEQFVFVSIDADLFDPIYHGLRYFYPRLQKGGYIFVHDYNSSDYTGAKAAVRRFSSEFDVSYFPLTDSDGSAVLMK